MRPTPWTEEQLTEVISVVSTTSAPEHLGVLADLMTKLLEDKLWSEAAAVYVAGESLRMRLGIPRAPMEDM